MLLAIFELRNANGNRLGALPSELLYLLQFFAELARILNFGDDLFGNLFVPIKEVQQLFTDTIDEVGSNFSVAKLVFGLGLEDWILKPDGDSADHALAHVIPFKFFTAIFVDRLEQPFAKS